MEYGKKNALKIGVVGFSRNSFDQATARSLLEDCFIVLKSKHENRIIEIVSGYTAQGVPLIAYELAVQYGFVTVGFSARQALWARKGVFSVDKENLVGDRYGDESEAFVEYIDGLIRIGGGKQSRHEVMLFRKRNQGRPINRLLIEHEVDWFVN